MGRIRAFEFSEIRGVPSFIRDSITEILGRSWRMSGAFDAVGDAFADFCRKSGCQVCLDLGSGSGEPVALLAEASARRGLESISFILSDLFPNVPSMQEVAARHPRVRFHPEPVDAAHVPDDLQCDAYTVVTAFHHFPPRIAAAILADCVRRRRAIFIVDGPDLRRMLKGMPLRLMPVGALALFKNPFLSRKDRLLKAVFTFLLPLIPLAGMWDSLISALRFYSPSDFAAMTEGLPGDFVWEYREMRTAVGLTLNVFTGIPR